MNCWSRIVRSGKRRAGSRMRTATPRCKTVAYFSMEYMLSEALPIYSGGLGNVAGDQLKAAQRSGRARGRRRIALSAGLFPSGARPQRRPDALSIRITIPGSLPIKPVRDAEWRLAAADAHRSARLSSYGCAPGRCRWAGPSCTCWTPTIRRICQNIAASPASCMAAARSCVCDRNRCSGIGGWRLLRALGHPSRRVSS